MAVNTQVCCDCRDVVVRRHMFDMNYIYRQEEEVYQLFNEVGVMISDPEFMSVALVLVLLLEDSGYKCGFFLQDAGELNHEWSTVF